MKNNNENKDSEIEQLADQLYYFYNFRRKMTSILEKRKTSNNSLRPENGIDSEFKDIELNKYVQNKFCLIDRNWIKIWKRYTGYKEIFNLYNGNFIQDKDLSNIKSIIEKNIREKNLVNLDMTKIYKNNSLDINSNFDIFLVKFIHFFIPENIKNKEIFKKCYPVMIKKNKYIIKIDDKTFQIFFKEKKSGIYFHILIKFKEINSNNSKIIKEFENEDLNIWLQNNKFMCESDEEKEIIKYNCKFVIINKRLKIAKENSKTMCLNSIKPNNTFLVNELIIQNVNKINKINKIPKECKTTLQQNLNKTRNIIEEIKQMSIHEKTEKNNEEIIEQKDEEKNIII